MGGLQSPDQNTLIVAMLFMYIVLGTLAEHNTPGDYFHSTPAVCDCECNIKNPY